MITEGLPHDATGWPDGLLEHLQKFEQGHLVADLPFFYFGDPERPIFGGPQDSESDALVWHETTFDFGVIATETCDLREQGVRRPRKPWIHCCPVYCADDPRAGISTDLRAHVRRGRVDYLLEVPDVPRDGLWIADLRLIVPIEKSYLLGRDPIEGFPDERSRRQIGERIAHQHSRPAFDDELVKLVIDPLVASLSEMSKGDAEAYASMTTHVYALAVRADRLVSMTLDSVELLLLCWDEPSPEAIAFWDKQSESWAQEALRTSSHRLQSLQIVTLSDLSAAQLLELQVVPLRGLTPHPLWHLD